MVLDDGHFAVALSAAYSGAASRKRRGLRLACSRMRVQLGVGFLASVIVPLGLSAAILGDAGAGAALNSILASLAAMVLGFIALRKLTNFPGVRTTRFVLPVYLAFFGLTAVGLLALRVDYSRYFLLIAFLLTTIGFTVVLLIARSGARLVLQTPANADRHAVGALARIDWIGVAQPEHLDPLTPLMIDLRSPLSPDWERAVAARVLEGGIVYSAADLQESLSGRVLIASLSESLLGQSPAKTVYAAVKRQVDFVFAALALIVLSPVLALIALIVKADSAGPAIFRQTRVGLCGRSFTMFKFRSMEWQGAAQSGEPSVAGAARLTRIGRWLRPCRLDELPQIFNILRGDMSWIGPRPESLDLSQTYEQRIPYYRLRHLVRPGLSGWAQVNQGHVTRLQDIEVKLHYDFFYIKNFSIWLDLLVVLKTVRVVVTGFGAR